MSGTRIQWVGVTVAAVMLVASGGCARSQSATKDARERMRKAPLAAVLVSGAKTELHVIDLETGKRLTRVKLRSLALQVGADPESRCFVTSQCGGVGADADDAAALYDTTTGAGVDYVKLPYANPGQFAVRGGRAWFVHGIEGKRGLRTSTLDVADRSIVGSGYAPPMSGDVRTIGDFTYLAHADLIGEPNEIGMQTALDAIGVLDGISGEETHVAEGVLKGGGFLASDPASPDGSRILMAGYREVKQPARAISSEIWRIDATTGRVPDRVPLKGMKYGVAAIASCDGGVAVLDHDFDDYLSAARLVRLDPTTLLPQQVTEIKHGPVALAGWRGGYLVADGAKGRVRYFEHGAAEAQFSIELGPGAVSYAIAVLDEPGAQGGLRTQGERSARLAGSY